MISPDTQREYQSPLEKRNNAVTQLIRDMALEINQKRALSYVPADFTDENNHAEKIQESLNAFTIHFPLWGDELRSLVEDYDAVGYDNNIKVRKIFGGQAYYSARRTDYEIVSENSTK